MTSSSEFVESAEDFYRYLESESVEVLPSDLSFLDFFEQQRPATLVWSSRG